MDIKFTNDTEEFIVVINNKDIDKLARVLYELCLDNRIDATIIRKNK